MKKSLLLLALFTVSVLTVISLGSCSGDDGPEENLNSTEKEPVFGIPSDHLPKDQNFFNGFWLTSGGPCSFILYPDGTCKGISNTQKRSIGFGQWTYNTVTNILSTTLQSSQYQVTLCNSEGTAWTGVQLGSNLAQTFFYGLTSQYFISTLLAGTKWTNGSNTIEFGPSLETMLYSNNYDKSPSYQYVKRVFSVRQNTPSSLTELTGSYNVKSYVNYNGSYRWIDDVSGSFMVENYLTSTPTLHMSSEPSSEYKLAK